MDVRQLTYFLAVAEHQHFGRAAEHLHVAQPSLSQAISRLERELGVPLFHRVGRGIALSDAGRQMMEPARQVLRDVDAARSAALSTRKLERGRVELVAMPSPGMEPLSTIVRRFTEDFPAMSLVIDAAFTPEEVVHAVRSGKAEVGLLGSASQPHPRGLEVIPIEDQPLVLISPPGETPTAGGSSVVSRGELAGTRLIVSKQGSLMRQLVDDILAAGVQAEIVVEVEHRTSILPMVLAGVGHAVMPSSWTSLAERTGAVVRPIDPPSVLRIALVTRGASLTPAAHAFVACVRHYTRELQQQNP